MITVKNLPKKLDLKKIKLASNFYLEYLLGKRMAKNVNVCIVFEKQKKSEFGSCMWEDDNIRPREFTITVHNDMGERSTLLTIAHEMVHVKQFVRGNMKDRLHNKSFVTYWNGVYSPKHETDYWEQPWEIEAHGREKGLYYKFLDYIHKQKTNDKKT